MGIRCEMVKVVNDGVVMFHRVVEQEITLALGEAASLLAQKRESKRIVDNEQRLNLVCLRLTNVLAFCGILENLYGRKVDEASIRNTAFLLWSRGSKRNESSSGIEKRIVPPVFTTTVLTELRYSLGNGREEFAIQ